MIASGHLSSADYVWREGMAEWQAAETVPELSGAYPTAQAYKPSAEGYQQSTQHPIGYQQPYQPPTYTDATSHYQTKFRRDQQEGTATTAFTLSIVGLLCAGPILGPIALVMGISALNSIKRTRSEKGKGLAIAAIVIGGLETLGTILLVVLLVMS
jgi:hypothetical protein